MIELTPQQQQYVEAQVATGTYKEPAEVVQAAFDLLRRTAQRERDETIEDIRQSMEDEKAGRVRPLKEVVEEIRQEIRQTK